MNWVLILRFLIIHAILLMNFSLKMNKKRCTIFYIDLMMPSIWYVLEFYAVTFIFSFLHIPWSIKKKNNKYCVLLLNILSKIILTHVSNPKNVMHISINQVISNLTVMNLLAILLIGKCGKDMIILDKHLILVILL